MKLAPTYGNFCALWLEVGFAAGHYSEPVAWDGTRG